MEGNAQIFKPQLFRILGSGGNNQANDKGSCEQKSGTTEISLKSLEIPGFFAGGTMKLNGIGLTIREKDKIPEIKQYEDILKMDEEKVDEVFGDIEEFAEDFLEDAAFLEDLLDLFY